jgi:hypothetical protein
VGGGTKHTAIAPHPSNLNISYDPVKIKRAYVVNKKLQLVIWFAENRRLMGKPGSFPGHPWFKSPPE